MRRSAAGFPSAGVWFEPPLCYAALGSRRPVSGRVTNDDACVRKQFASALLNIFDGDASDANIAALKEDHFNKDVVGFFSGENSAVLQQELRCLAEDGHAAVPNLDRETYDVFAAVLVANNLSEEGVKVAKALLWGTMVPELRTVLIWHHMSEHAHRLDKLGDAPIELGKKVCVCVLYAFAIATNEAHV